MTAARQEYFPGLEDRTGKLTVAGEIWNLLREYDGRLSTGMEKLLALEEKSQWDAAMFAYWQRVETEYKVVHECFALEALRIRYNKPPRFKSIEEVKGLLRTR